MAISLPRNFFPNIEYHLHAYILDLLHLYLFYKASIFDKSKLLTESRKLTRLTYQADILVSSFQKLSFRSFVKRLCQYQEDLVQKVEAQVL